MVYVLCVGIVILSGVVGKFIAKSFVLRDGFIKELIHMVTYFKNNISFKQTKVIDLFNDYIKLSEGKYTQQIKTLSCLVNKNIDAKQYSSQLYFLKKEELAVIIKFFEDIGTSSEEIEVEKVEVFLEYLKNKSKDAESARQKNEGLAYKVSIAIGIVVSILII